MELQNELEAVDSASIVAEGCKNLWNAVVVIALKDLIEGSIQEKNQARWWIGYRKADRFNSFESLCTILDLDADAIRERIGKKVKKGSWRVASVKGNGRDPNYKY